MSVFDPIEEIEEQAIKDAETWEKWQNYDAENELTKILQEQITKEINDRILEKLQKQYKQNKGIR